MAYGQEIPELSSSCKGCLLGNDGFRCSILGRSASLKRHCLLIASTVEPRMRSFSPRNNPFHHHFILTLTHRDSRIDKLQVPDLEFSTSSWRD